MSGNFMVEQRTGPRYMVTLPVRAEWDDAAGEHVVVEGATENVGPEGALVHLKHLPDVGSRVQLVVLDGEKFRIEAVTEVLRIQRDPGHPLAALQLISATEEWRGLVWEPSAPRVREAKPADGDEEEEDFEH
ncbi:MAG TPA: PilZ domain-containing protein [Pyrinomonadaceae bacterium]|nr:PilZ domain-containing protein [Pyrinomonadaceae bacterium]